MFIKFSCGCVGLNDGMDRSIVIHACDLNGEDCWEPLGLHRRDMTDKTYTPLPAVEVEALLGELGHLLYDGYKFRKIKSLLSPA